RFGGSTEHSHKRNIDMRDHLQDALSSHKRSVEFIGQVPPERVPTILAETDICVFPSVWENFANVCLESMAAGRGVVASEAGGMAEMLDFGKFGRTIPPRSYRKIAQAIIELLDNPQLRMKLGKAARDRLLREYNVDRIGELQEASYCRAMERRREQGSRAI
ncbi:MAG: glycosyltransferase family 4 protein, partial [Pseudomonadota bacterium]